MMNLLLAINPQGWFAISSAISFAAMILFFNVNSALADRKKWNKAFIVIGIILALLAIALMYFQVIRHSN